VELLTIHYHSHILDKTIDDLESLRYGDSSLVLCESIQSLKHLLDVVLPKKLLDKFLWAASGRVL